MADIDIHRKHKIGLKKAKVAAQRLADDLAEHFDLTTEWQGNVLHFTRSGVTGRLSVTKDQVSLQAKLGFLLSALKPRIERRVEEDFEKYFV
ncbi:MAG TPA: polyhydroxyalkanoic acid system family protein [Burkholderiaceae bacterium]|nr:polyhydroxyalkanoic acid system family protein [Burkholderiaceae bacterium]